MKLHKRELSLKHYLVGCLCILAFSYFLFQARYMVLGPQVWITYPEDGALVASSVLSVEGGAKNVARITLNGRQIFTNEEGRWSESVVVPPGTSLMTVKTVDRFGREEEKTIQVYAN